MYGWQFVIITNLIWKLKGKTCIELTIMIDTTVVFLQFHLCWNFSSLIWWISVLVYFVIDWHHIQMKCPLLFSVLDDKAGNLRFQSEKYKKDATYLNLRSAYAKYAAVGTIFVVLLIYVRFWWFWGIIYLFHDK